MGLFSKVFGSYSDRQVKKVDKLANIIEGLADKYSAMTDSELKEQTNVLKERLQKGETLDDILCDAFAVVREASTRILGKRHYHVQLIGGIIIHQGRIAEMKTGEGKTLMATLPAYLNALSGKGVHVVTVNEYLARRDSEWMGKIYRFLGLKVGLVVHQMSPADKRAAYEADITYGTNSEFGFDYLRDNMVVYKSRMVQRGHNFAIVDEVDSVLIDEARTPLIISGPSDDSSPMYEKADAFVRGLKVLRIKEIDAKESQEDVEEDYIVDEKARTAVLTSNGVKKAEKYFGIENLGDIENNDIMHYINNAIKARGVMKNEVDYIVNDGQVLIVDAFTGRIMHGRRYSNGLHQAIEAKEGVKVEKENKTQATITYQNFFRLYSKLSGMTGTALTEENEFREIYALDVVEIPTNKPMIRKDHNDVVYTTTNGKYAAIVEQIKACHEKGQPVLVGTVSIDKSEIISKILSRSGIKHNVLNAKYHEKEAEIIAQAGKFGAVTISTNMTGRGTDIMLGGNAEFLAKKKLRDEGYDDYMIYEATSFGETDNQEIIEVRAKFKEYNDSFQKEIDVEAEKVRNAGGLFILGTERHESRRIDNQLRGRAGRQGDPGETRFFISLEDDLMRLFGGDRIIGIVNKLNISEDQAIDAKLVSNSIETAQKRLEGTNFERRKHVLEYDDVMNQQREIIYGQRRSVLDDSDMTEKIKNMIYETISSSLDFYAQSEIPDEWNFDGIKSQFRGVILADGDLEYSYEELNALTREKLEKILIDKADNRFAEQETLFTPEIFKEAQRAILLRVVDKHWVDHIDAMDDLISGINLHAFAQRSPINEYKIQGAEMFDAMISSIREETVRIVLTAKPVQKVERKQVMTAANAGLKGQTPEKKVVITRTSSKKIGRNDPCPCASGKKYKKCSGAVGPKTEE